MTSSSQPIRIKNFEFFEKDIIGAGGFAEVFKGRDIHSKKEVAVKRVLKKKIDHQVKLWRGLKTEVNILSRNDIDRHHITKLFLFDETEDYYFEILELCETDLKKVIRKRRNLILSEKAPDNEITPEPCIPEEIAGIFFVHLILGLETVHEKNMLHRDLKPENLLLVKNSSLKNSKGPLTWNECTLKISDFGFSRQLPTDTFLAQTFCGTQVYMSPEVTNGAPYGKKSDFWSCGCILYEMITGVPPFLSSSLSRLAKKITTDKVKYPSYVSLEAKQVIHELLRKNPSNRIDIEKLKREPFFLKYYKFYLSNQLFPAQSPNPMQRESNAIVQNRVYQKAIEYLEGDEQKGIKRDEKKAKLMLEILAEKNHPPARYTLAYLIDSQYFANCFKDQKPSEICSSAAPMAKVYFARKALAGDSFCQFQLGTIYFSGTKANQENAMKLIQLSVQKENSCAHNLLGEIYKQGNETIKPDVMKVFEHLNAAARLGNSKAQLQLGYCYFFGKCGAEKSIPESISFFKKSADQGNPHAALELAKILENEEFGCPNFQLSLEYLVLASNYGQPQAQAHLAKHYFNGKFVKQNFARAIQYYKQSSIQKIPIALIELAQIFESGKILKKNITKSLELYKLAAESEEASSEEKEKASKSILRLKSDMEANTLIISS